MPKRKPIPLVEVMKASNTITSTSSSNVIVRPSGTHYTHPGKGTPIAPADESNTLVGGTKIRSHRRDKCMGYWCCIHNPSPHHMKSWDQHYDHTTKMMYRICEHGVEHPDPDDPWAWQATGPHAQYCDGCCKSDGRIRRRTP